MFHCCSLCSMHCCKVTTVDVLLDFVAETPTKLDLKTFPKVVVVYTLKAMQLGSLVARQQFPRLLQLLELYPHTVDDFIKKVCRWPHWVPCR